MSKITHKELENIYRDNSKTHKEKVEASIKAFQHYMDTYDYSTCGGNGNTFSGDVLYMLGVALDPNSNGMANGYSNFKGELLARLQSNQRLKFKGE